MALHHLTPSLSDTHEPPQHAAGISPAPSDPKPTDLLRDLTLVSLGALLGLCICVLILHLSGVFR